jgi:phage shock protein A
MLQMNEIQQRFTDARRAIDQASQACKTQQSLPQDLRDCLQQLDQRSSEAQQVMQSQDEDQIRQYVDELEQISDRAERAVQEAGSIDSEVRNAVDQAHRELSNLKHQLH